MAPHSRAKIRVVILSDLDSGFDPLQVDISTIQFGPDGSTVLKSKVRDSNADGIEDLIVTFQMAATGIECGDVEAELTATTYDGQLIAGSDSLKTNGCRQQSHRHSVLGFPRGLNGHDANDASGSHHQ